MCIRDRNSVQRKDFLDVMSKSFESCIKPVEYTVLDFDTKEGEKTFSEMNKNALAQGYEGLMIKPVNDIYECKRSHAWLKIKPFIAPPCSSDFAHITKTSAIGALEIHIFEPVIL